jgi:Cu(I)/Ag(I) efflux system membrane fusion protein
MEELRVSGRVLSGSTIALQVLEADASKLRLGQSLRFSSPGSNEEFKGKITGIDSVLDPMTRTLRATGSLSTSQGLRAESSGVATVEINLGSGLSVPEDAVLRTGADDVVYLVKENRLIPRKVKLGPRLNGAYKILDGLSEGDEVSSGSNFLIDSEARIRSVHD